MIPVSYCQEPQPKSLRLKLRQFFSPQSKNEKGEKSEREKKVKQRKKPESQSWRCNIQMIALQKERIETIERRILIKITEEIFPQ